MGRAACKTASWKPWPPQGTARLHFVVLRIPPFPRHRRCTEKRPSPTHHLPSKHSIYWTKKLITPCRGALPLFLGLETLAPQKPAGAFAAAVVRALLRHERGVLSAARIVVFVHALRSGKAGDSGKKMNIQNSSRGAPGAVWGMETKQPYAVNQSFGNCRKFWNRLSTDPRANPFYFRSGPRHGSGTMCVFGLVRNWRFSMF